MLFIGSSYFNYNNLPETFLELSEHGGEKLIIDQHIPSGLFLADHAKNSVTRAKIKSKAWDYLVLQVVGVVMACVFFSSIFQKSSISNSYTAGLDQEEALYFREIGSNVVLESLHLWNIPAIPEKFDIFEASP